MDSPGRRIGPPAEMCLEVRCGQTCFSLCSHSCSWLALDARRPGLQLMETEGKGERRYLNMARESQRTGEKGFKGGGIELFRDEQGQ